MAVVLCVVRNNEGIPASGLQVAGPSSQAWYPPLFESLKTDLRRYHHAERGGRQRGSWIRACFTYGFIAVALYRYGRWARTIQPRWLAIPFKVVYVLLKFPVELLLGIDISLNADIGPGLYIGHFGGIFLHCNAGSNLSVTQDVTIGYKGGGKSDYWPSLGNEVYIGAGAKVIGNICIGDGVVIGANTVVTKDVPPYMRVVGAAVRMAPLTEAAAVASDSTAQTPS